MKWFLFIVACLGFAAHYGYAAQGKTRSLSLADGDVGEVRSAIGYSTILQFDTRPTSVVLGDQDAYKVEYVGEGLTVKPLVPGAKTNLFVFTDYARFNFRISASTADQADYLVKISRKRAKSSSMMSSGDPGVNFNSGTEVTDKSIEKSAYCGSTFLLLQKMATSASQKYLVVTFGLKHLGLRPGHELNFSPGDIEILQFKKSIPIENLYLDGLSFSRSKPRVSGTLVVKHSEFVASAPLLLGFSASFLKQPKCLRASFQPFK